MSKASRSNVSFRLALGRDFSLYPPNKELACRQHLVNSGGSRGGARGSRPPYFYTKLRLERLKKMFWDRGSPTPRPLSLPPPPIWRSGSATSKYSWQLTINYLAVKTMEIAWWDLSSENLLLSPLVSNKLPSHSLSLYEVPIQLAWNKYTPGGFNRRFTVTNVSYRFDCSVMDSF